MAQLAPGSPGGHLLVPLALSLSGSVAASSSGSQSHVCTRTVCHAGFVSGQSSQSVDWATGGMSTAMC